MSAAEFQVCSRCGQEYPYPVELHHSGEECAQRRRPALRVLLMVYDKGSRNGWKLQRRPGFNNALVPCWLRCREGRGQVMVKSWTFRWPQAIVIHTQCRPCWRRSRCWIGFFGLVVSVWVCQQGRCRPTGERKPMCGWALDEGTVDGEGDK